MPDPLFTDIHCHPELKTFLSANDEQNRLDCWHNISLSHLLEIIDRILLGDILGSQSSLSQLNNVSGTIALPGLYALEKAMINGDFINILGFSANLKTIACRLQQTFNNDMIDCDLLERISSPQSSYYRLFKETQTHLLNSITINPGYNLINNIGEYDPGMLNIIFNIEGGHNLFDSTSDSSRYGDVLSHLSDLKREHRYLYIGLAHVERNPLCTHAYGMKILHHNDFKPVGCGITPLGKEVIIEALNQPNRILIDIKHMSLEARRQYYEILETDYGSERIPILISHSGLTGVSWDNKPVACRKKDHGWIKVRYFKPEGLMGTKFNPWSINLYDEEIIKIVASDGLIGLNLDERILGAKQKRRAERVEYFSPEEFNRSDFRLQFFRSIFAMDWDEAPSQEELNSSEIRIQVIEILRDIIMNPDILNDLEGLTRRIDDLYTNLQSIPVLLSEKGIKHLCNNILHIVQVAGNNGWRHISIGSDFDGLINPVDSCRDATEYESLAQKLETKLQEMAETIPGFPTMSHIDQKVHDIMSGNAYRFLQTYFN